MTKSLAFLPTPAVQRSHKVAVMSLLKVLAGRGEYRSSTARV